VFVVYEPNKQKACTEYNTQPFIQDGPDTECFEKEFRPSRGEASKGLSKPQLLEMTTLV